MKLTNTQEIRACDAAMIQHLGYPSFALMENAAREFVRLFCIQHASEGNKPRILVLCGPGNNGGDGMAIARMLHEQGFSVTVCLTKIPEQGHSDTGKNYGLLQQMGIHCENELPELQEYEILIDALLGTGIQAEVSGKPAEWIATCRKFVGTVWAVDLLSGLNADSGKIITIPIQAHFTVTFHLPKYCHYVFPAAGYCGKILVADIGILRQITDALNISGELADAVWFRNQFRGRDRNSHKGKGGHLLIAGGSRGMSGAIALSARAAFRGGAGKVSVWAPGSVRNSLHQEIAELMSFGNPGGDQAFFNREDGGGWKGPHPEYSAMVMGPGMGQHSHTREFLIQLLPELQIPLVLDADALNLLSEIPDYARLIPAHSILTPHPGEMSRLCGKADIQEYRLEYARELAGKTNCIIVLKGAGTLIAQPDGTVWVCPLGNPVLATAGTGDILSGLIGAFLAYGHPPAVAAGLGVVLHAAAADEMARQYRSNENSDGSLFLEAGELLSHIPVALDQILR